jgi:hypothetical protein
MKEVHRVKLTPPELAKRWGVSSDKIRTFVESGELAAIDISTRRGERPRYLIDLADIEKFEAARAVVKVPEPKPRRKTPAPAKRYF